MSDYGVKIGINPGRYWDKKKKGILVTKIQLKIYDWNFEYNSFVGFFVTQKDNQIVKINKIH